MNVEARKDIGLGLGVIAIAVLLLFVLFPLGIDLPTNAESRAMAPDFWPSVIAGAAAVAGFCLLVQGIRRRNAEAEIGQVDEGGSTLRYGLRVAGLFAAMLLCYLLIPTLGLLFGAVLLCAGMIWLGGERRPPVIFGVSVVLPVLLYLFFNDFAGVPIPTGVFEDLTRMGS